MTTASAKEDIKQINLGQTSDDKSAAFDLFKFLETRLLIQASSGGGKSYLLRRIIEQVMSVNIPVWIIDPEGEFTTLRERFDLVIFGAEDGDLDLKPETLAAALPQLLKKGVSCVFDLSDLNLEEKRERVVLICSAILSLSKADWKSMLLCIDEAQIFAPEGKSSASIDAVTDLASRIRKRGVGLVVATQRLSALDKNLTSHLHNRVIGYCLEDIEVNRSAGYVGKANAKELVQFEPGDFFAMGAALNFRQVTRFHAGKVETTHPDPSTRRTLVAPKATTQLEHLLKELRQTIQAERKKEEKPKPELTDINNSEDLQNEIVRLNIELAEAKNNVPQILLEELNNLREFLAEREKAMAEIVFKASESLRVETEKFQTALKEGEQRAAESLQKLQSFLAKTASQPNFGSFPLINKNKSQEGAVPQAKPPVTQPLRTGRIKDDFLHRRQRKILDTLATFEQLGLKEVDRRNIAVFSGVSPKSSTFDGDLRFLRSPEQTKSERGLIINSGDGIFQLTDEGRRFARPSMNINSLEELHAAWCSYLPAKQGAMIRFLLQFHAPGKRISRTHFAQDTNQSETSSAFDNHVRALRNFGIIGEDKQNDTKCVYLTNLLFPDLK